MNDESLTFGSLFAGIGGIDLGLERAGWRCAWQCEIDDYATRVLQKHWPAVPKFRDVRSVGADNLPAVDLIAGGFPCQPHSESGRRRAGLDERDLWPEFRRVICELRPRWVMAENVPGLLSSDDGRFFGSVLRDLAQLRYDAEWSMLSACAMGASHARERMFVVAYSAGDRREWRRQCDTSHEAAQAWADQVARYVEASRRDAAQYRVYRSPHGVSRKLDRLRGLGNAVVPQVAEFVGRLIMEHAHAET